MYISGQAGIIRASELKKTGRVTSNEREEYGNMGIEGFERIFLPPRGYYGW